MPSLCETKDPLCHRTKYPVRAHAHVNTHFHACVRACPRFTMFMGSGKTGSPLCLWGPTAPRALAAKCWTPQV